MVAVLVAWVVGSVAVGLTLGLIGRMAKAHYPY